MKKLLFSFLVAIGCYGATPTLSNIEAFYRDDNCVGIKWTTNQVGTSAGARLDYGTSSAEGLAGTYKTRNTSSGSGSATTRNAQTCNMRGKVYFRPVSWDTGHINESLAVLCTNAGGAVITNTAYASQADPDLQFRCDAVGELPYIDFGSAPTSNPEPARPIHAIDLDEEPSCDVSTNFDETDFQSVLDTAGTNFNANPNTNYCVTSPVTPNFVIRPQDNTSRLDGWRFPNTDEGQSNWLTIKAGTPAKMRPPWGVQLSPEFLPWVPQFQWNEDDFWAISGNSTQNALFQPYSGCPGEPCVEGIAFNGVAIVNPDRTDLTSKRLTPTSYSGGTITVSGGVSSLRLTDSNQGGGEGSLLWIRLPGVFGLDGFCNVVSPTATGFGCSGKTGTGTYTGSGEIVQAQSIEITSCTDETCTLVEDFPFFENGLGTVTSITSGNVINISQTAASLQIGANDTVEIKGSSVDGFYAVASVGTNSITLSTNPGLANCTSGCTVAEARVVNILGSSDPTYNRNWFVDYTAGSETVTLQRANLGSITGSGSGGFMLSAVTNLDVPIKGGNMKRTIFRAILKVDPPFALQYFGYLHDQQSIVDSWVKGEKFSQIDLLTNRCRGLSFPATQGFYSGGSPVDFQGYRTTSLTNGFHIFKDASSTPFEDVSIVGWSAYRGNEHISGGTLPNVGYFCRGYQNIFEFKNINRADIVAHFRGGSSNRAASGTMLAFFNFNTFSNATPGSILDINVHDSIFYDGGTAIEFNAATDASLGDRLRLPLNNAKVSNTLIRSDFMKYQATPTSICGVTTKCTNGGWGGIAAHGAVGALTFDRLMVIPKNNPNTAFLTSDLSAPAQNLRISNIFAALTQDQNVAGGGFHSNAGAPPYTRPVLPGANGATFLDHWEDMAGNGPTLSNFVLSGGTHFSLSGDTDARWASATDATTIRADEITAPNGGQGINGITGLLGLSTVIGATGNPSESANARLDLVLQPRTFKPIEGEAAEGTIDLDQNNAVNFIIPDARVQPVDSDTVRLTFTAPSISQNCWYQYTTVANGYGASSDPDLVSEWILVPEDGVTRSVDINLTTATSYDLRLSCGRSPIHRRFTTGAGSISSSAVTYYVDDTGGDDMNDCSSGAKCATIDHAVSLASPGDTVLVSDGTYDAVTIDVSGTKGLPIHIQAVNRHGAVIDGNGAAAGILVNDGKSWLDINGFEVVDALSGIVIGSGDGDNHHIRVRRNYIHDIGITQCSTSSGSFAGIKSKIDSSFMLIEQNHFDNIGRRRPGESGCSPGNNNYMNHDHAIYIFGRNHVVRNNKTTNIDNGWSFQSPRGLYDTDVLFNTFYQTNPDRDGCAVLDNEANDTETHGYNLRFVGNICIGTNGFLSIAGDPLPCGEHTNTKVKYNLFSGATAVLDENSDDAVSCSDFLQHHNQPSTTATYVNAPTDLNLQAGSNGEDDGPIGYVTDDYDGNARSTTTPDLGAFEQ